LIREVQIAGDGELDLRLLKDAIQLSEITIRSQAADESVKGSQIGVQTLDVKTIEKLPAFLGEVDVVKSFLLQPGVSSMGEGASGFNVRGGDVDQNLIRYGNSPILNSSHALGFFSTFNSDLIRRVDLYKGNIPAQYGGRLASVMNVEMRDGNFEQLNIRGGIGPVSSRMMIEAPIVKDKVSFIVGGRSSYADWVLDLVDNIEVNRSDAFFYDLNGRLTIKPNDRHTLTLGGYTSVDEFFYNEEFGFDYTTQFADLSYKFVINDQLLSHLSASISDYKSSQFDLEGLDATQLDNGVKTIQVREEVIYADEDRIELIAGAEANIYEVDPGQTMPFGDFSIAQSEVLQTDKGWEAAAFANVEYEITEDLVVNGGIRFNYFQLNGPREVFTYANPEEPTESEILGSSIETGTIADYSTLEPRFSLRYSLTDETSLKLGYARTSQFINQIFNTDSPTPTSQWQLSTNYLEPLLSHNVSLGYFRNWDNNNWETSLEFYGRSIDQLYDYIDFADLIVNPHIETELRQGIGRTYGAELSIKKPAGILNGWMSYTYSRAERKIDGINNGEWYPSNFDKPHDLTVILNYNPNQRNTYTMSFNYGTGRPTTAPVGNFISDNGIVVPVYDQRNQQRIPDYLRLDLAYTLGQGYKKDAALRTSWTISVYNVLGRRNPFSVFFTQGAFQGAQANRLSVLGSVFPSITLNIELL
ncbi:MAG: TonB-dependent receptor, partial [Bacteroidota bacterium]